MQFWMLLIVAFMMGAITPIYLPMNSSVARYVGSPILANVSFFFMALAVTLIALSVMLLWTSNEGVAIFSKFKEVPLYLYLGGVFSALLVLGTTILIPRLGASTFFVLFVSGQVILAAVISHFGLLESPQEPISVQKMAGITLLITGVALVTFKEVSWISASVKSLGLNLWGT